MHKANYEKLETITVFANAAMARGIAAVIGTNGRITPAGAGVFPNVITCDHAERVGEPIQGAIPNGGIIPVLSGGAISVGANVATDANGKAVVATAGQAIIGTAVTAVDAADEFVGIQFTPRGTVPTA